MMRDMATVAGFVVILVSAALAILAGWTRQRRESKLSSLDKKYPRITGPEDHLSNDPGLLKVATDEYARIQDLEHGTVVPTAPEVRDLIEESKRDLK